LLNKAYKYGLSYKFEKMTEIRWIEEIVKAIEELGGEANYPEIYGWFEKNTERELPPSWKAIIRRNIEENSSDSTAFLGKNNLFYSVGGLGSGKWGLKKKSISKRYWLEISAKSTRRNDDFPEYSFGKVLWSPQGGRWSNMLNVSPGDIILHLNKDSKEIEGISLAKDNVDDSFYCLKGTQWGGEKGDVPGYLIRLKGLKTLNPGIQVYQDLLSKKSYEPILNQVLSENSNLFYNINLNLQQGRYLTRLPEKIVELINNSYKGKSGENLPYFLEDSSFDEDMKMIKKIYGISKKMRKFKENPDLLIDEINNLDEKDIKEANNYYLSRTGKKINEVRLNILNILKSREIEKKEIEKIKKDVNKKYSTNILANWGNFGILYYIFYHKYKAEINEFLEKFSNRIITDLNIQEFTKKHIVGFDGAQNQGAEQIWMAIYNKIHDNQRTAKQLYFSIGGGFFREGITCGLYKHGGQKDRIVKIDVENYNYNSILEIYRRFIDEIKNDGIKGNMASKVITLLESKKQIILYGPPGTGKTYKTKKYAVELIENE